MGVLDRDADEFGMGVDGCGVAGCGDGVVGGAARGDSGGCCESSSIEPAP